MIVWHLVIRKLRGTCTVCTSFKYKPTKSTESSASPLRGFAAAWRAQVSARVAPPTPLTPSAPATSTVASDFGVGGLLESLVNDARRGRSGVSVRGGGLSTPRHCPRFALHFPTPSCVLSSSRLKDASFRSEGCRASQNWATLPLC
jgi:hypothetical protein